MHVPIISDRSFVLFYTEKPSIGVNFLGTALMSYPHTGLL